MAHTFYQQKHKPFSNKFAKYTFICDTTNSDKRVEAFMTNDIY